jgi:hypothetical protein
MTARFEYVIQADAVGVFATDRETLVRGAGPQHAAQIRRQISDVNRPCWLVCLLEALDDVTARVAVGTVNVGGPDWWLAAERERR